MEVLVEGGADPNGGAPSGQTPLTHAAQKRALPPLRKLIELGADPRSSPHALHALVRPLGRKKPAHDVVACVALLLAKGADPHALGVEGSTPLALAQRDPAMPPEVLSMLASHGG